MTRLMIDRRALPDGPEKEGQDRYITAELVRKKFGVPGVIDALTHWGWCGQLDDGTMVAVSIRTIAAEIAQRMVKRVYDMGWGMGGLATPHLVSALRVVEELTNNRGEETEQVRDLLRECYMLCKYALAWSYVEDGKDSTQKYVSRIPPVEFHKGRPSMGWSDPPFKQWPVVPLAGDLLWGRFQDALEVATSRLDSQWVIDG